MPTALKKHSCFPSENLSLKVPCHAPLPFLFRQHRCLGSRQLATLTLRVLRRRAAAGPLLCNAAASRAESAVSRFCLSLPVVVVEEDLEGHDGHSFLSDLVLEFLDFALEEEEARGGGTAAAAT